MRLTLFFLTCIVCSVCSQAQTPARKWGVSVGYGPSLPTGDFIKTAPEKSIARSEYGNQHHYVSGFPKDGNSAALKGTSALLRINYGLHRTWTANLKIGYTANPVNTLPATDYANDWIAGVNPNQTLTFIQDDYQVLTLSFGGSYNFRLKKFAFSVSPNIGLGVLVAPEYTLKMQVQNFPTAALFIYRIDENKINSPVFGIDGAIFYDVGSRFYFGLAGNYSHADFAYEWTMRAPGLDTSFGTDEVTYRTVQLTAQLGFRF